MNTNSTFLTQQVQHGIDRYENWHQVAIPEKQARTATIVQIVLKNEHRWGDDQDIDPDSHIPNGYVEDVIEYYLTQRHFVRALKMRQHVEWQTVVDKLTLRISRWLYTHTNQRRERIVELTEDLVQHCATVIWMRLDAFPFDCPFWAWVNVITTTEMIDYLDTADYRHNVNAERLDDMPFVVQHDTAFQQIEASLMIKSLLPNLSMDQRLAISLTLYGYSCEEIAELMDRSVSAVHNLRSRAYQLMRRITSEEDSLD